MQQNKPQWTKFELNLSGLKFAVIVISIFTIFMIVGTFLESYQGTDYANRVIYKKWPFMLLQLSMFVSIIYAVYRRLPAKKHFYGFYTIHAGLVMIGVGSFITYYSGIDGHITLYPNEPVRKIALSSDVLRIIYPDLQKTVTFKLPYSAFSTSLNDEYEGIKLKEYLPFSSSELKWLPSKEFNKETKGIHSAKYLIYNDNVSQEFVLSLNPEALDYRSTTQMGPLGVHFLPKELGKCFGGNSKSGLIVWDVSRRECYPPEEKNIQVNETSSKKRFLVIKHESGPLSFFPEFSPSPMSQDFNVVENAPIKVFSKVLFEKKPNLFLFGEAASYYDGESWHYVPMENNGKAIELPWMGFEIKLAHYTDSDVPTNVPKYVTPIQKNSKLIKGQQRSVRVEVEGKQYWISNDRPLGLMKGGQQVELHLGKEEIQLPFELSLKEFKMDKDPGTESPASYESYVRLFTKDGTSVHHIYMNNPLKYDGITFYQSSYFQTREGHYGSVLSTNIDKGRFLKYLGSLLLVLGATWHYYIRRKKQRMA